MLKSIFFTFYSALWSVALLIFKRHKKLGDGYLERCGYLSTGQKYADSCDLMLVAASAGEAFLALEIIEELAKSGQELKILVSTWTRQGLDILNKNSQLLEANSQIQVQVRFAFFDQPKIVKKVLLESKPKLIVLLETEIWFALLEEARLQSIKLAIINARLSANSLKYLSFFKKVLISPECIMSISKLDQERFAKLFEGAKFELMSNIKFDRSYKLLQAKSQEVSKNNNLNQYQDYILLASVREEEEVLLAKTLDWLLAKNEKINIIIAPRHMPRVEIWKKNWQAKAQNLQVFVASSPQNLLSKNIIIWDRFGELPALYASAKAIYVGGSLVDLGGQNFLESAGKKICVGKYLKNFAWAIDENLLDLGIIEIVENEIALAHSLHYDYQQNIVQKETEFFAWLAQKCGGTKQSSLYILEQLEQARAIPLG